MAKEKKEAAILNFDGVKYNIDELTDEQKEMVNHLSDLSRKIQTSEFNLKQLQVGNDAFLNSLRVSLDVKKTKEGV